MKSNYLSLSVFVLFALLIAGCSSSSTSVAPEINGNDTPVADASNSSHENWGIFNVNLDTENLVATVDAGSRQTTAKYNVTGFLLPPNCGDCFFVNVLSFDPAMNNVLVEIILRNPTAMTAYDTRVIMLDYDSKHFMDADGYTDMWEPGNAKNPFYNFGINNPDRAFGPGQILSRHFNVHLGPGATPDVTFLVDVSYPGQSVEPYEMRVIPSSWLINDNDDSTKLIAYVYDHQDDVELVMADISPLGGGLELLYDDGDHSDGEANDGIWCVKGIETTVPIGPYEIWVGAKSVGSDIITYQKTIVTVSDVDPFAKGDPDWDRIYDKSMVKRLEVHIPPHTWDAMQDDLAYNIGLPWDERDFAYFDCTVFFEGVAWHHVGIRYKGNSSITSPYHNGVKKLPFKFDFDEYEDTYPETKNHRFWGAKQLSFGNNFKDPTMLREILTYELFDEMGAYASRSSHYELWIDHGEGMTYFGLYNSNEVVDERYLDDRFGNDDGNLYKPEGAGADLTFFNQDSFDKKTNEDEEDWSDVINFIDVLNATYSSPEEFATAIETVFDVDSFIAWLAVNSALCNLDSYATMAHNYYLYNNPDDGLFYFIPWDCNESFGAFTGGINPDVIPEWDIYTPYIGNKPLISKILEVPEYMIEYQIKVRELMDGPMSQASIDPRIYTQHDIARPFVVGANGEFFPYTLLHNQMDFDMNIDSDLPPFGPNRILGLRPLLADRLTYLETVIP